MASLHKPKKVKVVKINSKQALTLARFSPLISNREVLNSQPLYHWDQCTRSHLCPTPTSTLVIVIVYSFKPFGTYFPSPLPFPLVMITAFLFLSTAIDKRCCVCMKIIHKNKKMWGMGGICFYYLILHDVSLISIISEYPTIDQHMTEEITLVLR